MSVVWTCQVCGVQNSVDDIECIGGCGHVHIAKALILSSEISEKTIRMHISTVIGRRNLVAIDTEIASVSSYHQFTLTPNSGMGGWVISHVNSAKNNTNLNGGVVTESPVLVDDGDIISIGNHPNGVRVTLEME